MALYQKWYRAILISIWEEVTSMNIGWFLGSAVATVVVLVVLEDI